MKTHAAVGDRTVCGVAKELDELQTVPADDFGRETPDACKRCLAGIARFRAMAIIHRLDTQEYGKDEVPFIEAALLMSAAEWEHLAQNATSEAWVWEQVAKDDLRKGNTAGAESAEGVRKSFQEKARRYRALAAREEQLQTDFETSHA